MNAIETRATIFLETYVAINSDSSKRKVEKLVAFAESETAPLRATLKRLLDAVGQMPPDGRDMEAAYELFQAWGAAKQALEE